MSTPTAPPAPSTTESPSKQAVNELVKQAIVVAALIVTVTFQAALTPPGGFWQEDSVCSDSSSDSPTFNYEKRCGYHAGKSALRREDYDRFMRWDIFAFGFSLCAIHLLLVGMFRHFALFCVGGGIGLLGWAFYTAIQVTKPPGSNAQTFAFGVVIFLSITFIASLVYSYKQELKGCDG